MIQPLLQAFAGQIQRQAPVCTALYIVGSLALDDFVPRWSDIDLVGVLGHPASAEDCTHLLSVHAQVERRYPRWKCEAMYFPASDLGCRIEEIQPFPCYQDGKLTWMARFPLSAVTWWTLKPRGISLLGAPAQNLDYALDLEELMRGQRQNLNSYWLNWTKHPLRILRLLTDWGVQWAVLGVLRQVYTLREHGITSKSGAGEYALRWMPECWQPIIREALALRRASGVLYYSSRVRRASDAFYFLRYAIQLGNQLA